MISNIYTGATNGIEGFKISVETDTISGLPNVIIVGLPDAAVSEAKERIRSAIKNSGYMFPMKRVIINLAPADVRKGRVLTCQWRLALFSGGEVMSNNLDDSFYW